MDENCRKKAFALSSALRNAGISAETDHMERSVKAQFKYADKIGAKYVGVIGSAELENGEMNVKKMDDGQTIALPFDKVVEYFSAL
jgi:histidyl-tRNA synthetase